MTKEELAKLVMESTKTARDSTEVKVAALHEMKNTHKCTYREIAALTGMPHEHIFKLLKRSTTNVKYRQPTLTGYACVNHSCRVRVFDRVQRDTENCPLCGTKGKPRNPSAKSNKKESESENV